MVSLKKLCGSLTSAALRAIFCVLCVKLLTVTANAQVVDRHGLTYNLGDEAVHIVFSADSTFEGGHYALDALHSAGATASFFFTGNFLRRPENAPVIRRAVAEGHYVGPHSDGHILLADWDKARTPLVTPDSLLRDLAQNFIELRRFGVNPDSARYVLPPFEWAAPIHAQTYRSAGYIPLGLTPGIETYADYTTPDMTYYRSAEYLWHQLTDYVNEHPINGSVFIIHLGTDDARKDKLWRKLPEILHFLKQKDYKIQKL